MWLKFPIRTHKGRMRRGTHIHVLSLKHNNAKRRYDIWFHRLTGTGGESPIYECRFYHGVKVGF
jgi:hypothetical protein